MGRLEERMDRELAEEKAYYDLEEFFIYHNMRPPSIGPWEWRLMFDRISYHESWGEAAADAKVMAMEIGKQVSIEEFQGTFRAVPVDSLSSYPLGTDLYGLDRITYTRLLILNGRYPDIYEIAYDQGRNLEIINYHTEVKRAHKFWKDNLTQIDIRALNTSLVNKRLPPDFWCNPTFLTMPGNPSND